MRPSKALELVERYASLTKQIKDCTQRISDSLQLCNGKSGNRQAGMHSQGEAGRFYETKLDSKGREQDLHLWIWYQPETVDDGHMSPSLVYEKVGEERATECPHCYAAHLAVQERKQARKELGAVKGAMSRSTT